MMSTKKLVLGLIKAAGELGLDDSDINNSIELVENREYGLAFDTIVTQLYEYEIEIDNGFYDVIAQSAHQMKIPESEYSFIKELIRAENVVPKPIKDRLAQLLTKLGANN